MLVWRVVRSGGGIVTRASSAALALTLTSAACVSSSFSDGTFACDPVDAPACPSGLVCAGDGRCRSTRSSADGAPRDASADAPGDVADATAPAPPLLGETREGASVDSASYGVAVAFPFVAKSSGVVGSLSVLLDASNRASTVEIGLYDDYFMHPGQRLASGDVREALAGWNAVTTSPATIEAGATYWIALISKTPGTAVVFDEDPASRQVHGEFTADSDLTELQSFWNSGAGFDRRPICAYASAP
jgi:hypothetical protein